MFCKKCNADRKCVTRFGGFFAACDSDGYPTGQWSEYESNTESEGIYCEVCSQSFEETEKKFSAKIGMQVQLIYYDTNTNSHSDFISPAIITDVYQRSRSVELLVLGTEPEETSAAFIEDGEDPPERDYCRPVSS